MKIFVKIILPIFATLIIVFTAGYYFLIYQMIRETNLRNIDNEYIIRVKSELTSIQGEMKARPNVSFGSPSSSAWNPRSSTKAVTCAAADKVIPEARRSGYNFLVAGNASDPSSQGSVNGMPLFVIIIDLNTLPKGFVAKDKKSRNGNPV